MTGCTFSSWKNEQIVILIESILFIHIYIYTRVLLVIYTYDFNGVLSSLCIYIYMYTHDQLT